MKNFGGFWTDKKLNAFINYVKAYTSILNKVKDRYGWKTIYFDGFAGCGKIETENKCDNKPKGFFDNENHSYQGSVHRVLDLPTENQFDYYYFVDSSEEYIDALKIYVEDLPKDIRPRVILRNDDCNNQLKKLSKVIKDNNKYRSLIFLDPFGMQIDWASIEGLKGSHSDIWILVPSGVAINRLLDKKKELKQIEKLEKFFGLSQSKIEEIFYRTVKRQGLFGDVEDTSKIQDPISKIMEIYINQLKTVWEYVTPKPLQLKNSKNCVIFHFIFASNNATALKIASDIIKIR